MSRKLIITFAIILNGVITLKLISKSYVNTDSLLGRVSNLLNRNNSISLTCKGLNDEKVKIFWVSAYGDPTLIFSSGKQIGRIDHEYGYNDFKILLNNEVKFNIGHFKTNNWHAHKYRIEIIKDSNKYKVNFEAIGPDSVNIERNFDLN